MLGKVGTVSATEPTATPALYQKSFGKYDVAVLVRVTIDFQAVNQIQSSCPFQSEAGEIL